MREAFRPLPRVLALLFLFLTGPAAAATLTGKADVVDADTIKIGGIPVRLYGIDAPESRQTCEQDGKSYACGKQATKTLADLIAGESVQCDIVGRDAFGRALGICSVAGTELNATREIIQRGSKPDKKVGYTPQQQATSGLANPLPPLRDSVLPSTPGLP